MDAWWARILAGSTLLMGLLAATGAGPLMPAPALVAVWSTGLLPTRSTRRR